MTKRLTKNEKRAARKPGVGGKKAGLWPNTWKSRARKVKKADRKRKKK